MAPLSNTSPRDIEMISISFLILEKKVLSKYFLVKSVDGIVITIVLQNFRYLSISSCDVFELTTLKLPIFFCNSRDIAPLPKIKIASSSLILL